MLDAFGGWVGSACLIVDGLHLVVGLGVLGLVADCGNFLISEKMQEDQTLYQKKNVCLGGFLTKM